MRTKKLTIVLAFAVALGLLAQSPVAADQSVLDLDAGTIVAAHSGKCLEIEGASLDDFARAQQFACNGGNHQLWLSGTGTLTAVHSRKCLEPRGIIALGAPVWQVRCQEANLAQEWVLVVIAAGSHTALVNIVQPSTRLCLTVADASLADGAGIVQLPCVDSAPHQTWVVQVR